MKILIIGSKGFIGSHCLANFKSKGHTVFGCDVIVDYNSENYFLIDATNSQYYEIFESNFFDVCVNCSGAANVQDSIRNPQRDFQLNTVNVFNLLNAIRVYNPTCKFINLSSAAVYGHPQKLPLTEDQPLLPISPYGFHKKYAEEICEQFFKEYHIRTCSLRIFSAYGPGLQKQLFWDLYKKSKTNQKIELFGTGTESRDFIFIDDLVKVIEGIIHRGNFEGKSINVASGKETTIKEAVTVFFQIFNPACEFNFNYQVKEGDPTNWCADIQQLRNFGLTTTTTLNEGLIKYVKWLKNEIL